MKDFPVVGELNVPFAAPEKYAEIATDWLEGGSIYLAKKEREEILTGDHPLSWGTADEDGQTLLGPPGSAWGSLVLTRPPLNTPESLLFSRKSLRRLHRIAPAMSTVKLELGVLDGEGYYHRTICVLNVDRIGEESGFARLGVAFISGSLSGNSSGKLDKSHKCLMFMREFLDQYTPTFGHVSYRYGVIETALEQALHIYPPETVYHSTDYLRGYSWLTIVPGVLAERLGGAGALRSKAAFVNVDELPGGSLWLLATLSWDQYQRQQIDAVFDALAPVLPAGMPEDYPTPLPLYPPLLVSWRDAHPQRAT